MYDFHLYLWLTHSVCDIVDPWDAYTSKNVFSNILAKNNSRKLWLGHCAQPNNLKIKFLKNVCRLLRTFILYNILTGTGCCLYFIQTIVFSWQQNKKLSQMAGVAIVRRSDSKLAITLTAPISVLIFFPFFVVYFSPKSSDLLWKLI